MPASQKRNRLAVRVRTVLAALFTAAMLQGCYYLQAVNGQLGVWNKSRPLTEVIEDPATDPNLRRRLQLLLDARDFATDRLLLPDNGSYRNYADLQRPYVLWNVIATPEFSLEPRTWCYLVVGCLAYRGYFDIEDAERLADKLAARGLDVFVGGVPAYSTLGRFDDPLLNTMMQRDDADLIALLFHELAHQRLYLKDDTAFNETFASAVAEFGLQAWFEKSGDSDSANLWLERQALAESRMQLLDATRQRLSQLYEQSPADVREKKRQVFEELRCALAGESADKGGWQSVELNNAWLATFDLYRGDLPAFRKLFADCAGAWPCFYDAVDALGAMPREARAQSLAELAGS